MRHFAVKIARDGGVLRRRKTWKPGDRTKHLHTSALKVCLRTPHRHADVEAAVRGGGRLRSRRAAQSRGRRAKRASYF